MELSLRGVAGWAAAVIFLIPFGTAAEEIKGHYQIRDRGQLRHFEVATDELQSRFQPASIKIIPRANAEAARQHAKKLSESSGEEIELVLYERGATRSEFSKRILTREILVKLHPGTNEEMFAKQFGLKLSQKFDGGMVLLEARETGGALIAAEKLRAQPEVISAEPQLAKQMQKKLVPNDTWFSQQWHLLNTGQNGGTNGIDVNITNVWDTYRGAGITIGIVDDGLQLTHPDLAPNINTTIDWDFNYNDADPSPIVSSDRHGTAVAGVAAARGNNGSGVAGAAFEATLVGLRLVSLASSDAQEAAAMSHSNQVIFIKNNSWGPEDEVGILEGPGPLMMNALSDGTANGRNGKGTIYVWAGGNGGAGGDNVNYDGYANSIYTFPIAALADTGRKANYSEPGACLVVTTPSSSILRQGITTTDLIGANGYNMTGSSEVSDLNYTQKFSGTSSATPLAAGVIALILQANPNLSYRDVKEILMRSATRNDATESDWRTNANGLHFNHKYGAGLINAGEAITLATNWSNLGSQQHITVSQTNLALAIPDNNSTGISRTFQITNENFRVEYVTLTVTAPHTRFGNLAITLTSPAGTPSALAELHDSQNNSGYDNWKFSTVRNWGEHASGTWTVKIADLAATRTGTLNDLQLEIYGSTPEATLALVNTSTNRQITLRAAATGWNYVLQTSEDLTGSWTNRGVFNLTHNGVSTLSETNFPEGQRFYRALLQP